MAKSGRADRLADHDPPALNRGRNPVQAAGRHGQGLDHGRVAGPDGQVDPEADITWGPRVQVASGPDRVRAGGVVATRHDRGATRRGGTPGGVPTTRPGRVGPDRHQPRLDRASRRHGASPTGRSHSAQLRATGSRRGDRRRQGEGAVPGTQQGWPKTHLGSPPGVVSRPGWSRPARPSCGAGARRRPRSTAS